MSTWKKKKKEVDMNGWLLFSLLLLGFIGVLLFVANLFLLCVIEPRRQAAAKRKRDLARKLGYGR